MGISFNKRVCQKHRNRNKRNTEPATTTTPQSRLRTPGRWTISRRLAGSGCIPLLPVIHVALEGSDLWLVQCGFTHTSCVDSGPSCSYSLVRRKNNPRKNGTTPNQATQHSVSKYRTVLLNDQTLLIIYFGVVEQLFGSFVFDGYQVLVSFFISEKKIKKRSVSS